MIATFSSPPADASACIERGSTSPPCWLVRDSASRRSTTAFCLPASCTIISDTSTWSRKPCNHSTTRSARGCHPCHRYVVLPICPGRTGELLERAKGFEPSTPTLARSCSTTELHPHPRGRRWCADDGQSYAKCGPRMQQLVYGSIRAVRAS